MASLHCPHCGAALPPQETWAQAAVSTLIASPAVPDMASQVRCEKCGRVSAASELRRGAAGPIKRSRLLLWLLLAALSGWLVIGFLLR
jgi:hypothetical protein